MTQERAKAWEKEVSKLDTEELITEIEKLPAIWDSSAEEYSDKIAKRNAWSSVITAFFPDFADKSPEDKKVLGSIIQRRWKSLRDGYSRENLKRKTEQKSGAAASARKTYVYYEQLKFLETLTKTTKDSIADAEGEGLDDPEGEDTQLPVEVTRPVKKPKSGNKQDVEDDILMKTLKAQLLQKSVDANDEDRLFMMSLVPELKKVPDFMKLEAKTRLMGVFSQIRLEVQRMNSTQPPLLQQGNFNYNVPSRPGPGHYGGFQGPNQRPMGPQDSLLIQQNRLQVTVPMTSPSATGNFADLSPADTFSSNSSEVDFGNYKKM